MKDAAKQCIFRFLHNLVSTPEKQAEMQQMPGQSVSHRKHRRGGSRKMGTWEDTPTDGLKESIREGGAATTARWGVQIRVQQDGPRAVMG